MIDIVKTKEEMEYALQTGWDRDTAIRHGLEVITYLENKFANAIIDIKYLYENSDDACNICVHHTPCVPSTCPDFVSGVGAVTIAGEEIPDWTWTCEDFDFGDCPAMEDTPCHNCRGLSNWKWRHDL